MKTIKSVLLSALVTLVGSSVWAAVDASAEPNSFAQVYKGESVVVTLKNSGSTAASEANLKVNNSTSSSSGAAKTWTGTYLKAELSSGGLPRASQSVPGTATLTITGLETTDSKQTIQVWNSNTKLVAITITKVTEPPFIDHGEVSIAIAPEGKQVITATSAAAADWTIWSDKEDVAAVDFRGSSATNAASFTITAKGKVGETTTCVASNKYAKWTYKVGIDVSTVNFARGATERQIEFVHAGGATTWYAWTDDPEKLVSVKLESADPKKTLTDAPPTGAEKVTGARTVRLTITHELTNPSGTAKVYVQAGEEEAHEIKVVCDAVNSIYFNMRHSDTLEEMSETSQSWYKIPTEWVKPSDINADYGHTFSADTNVIEIVEADGAFWLHAPEKGHDGVVRVVFIKDERELLNGGGKIWMFNVTVNTVEIEKFLTFKDESKRDSEATLNIRTHYLNNVTEDITNRVLFVGTGCNSHSLDRGTIADTLTTIAKKAEVDYYIFEGGETVSAAKANGGVGTLKKDRSITADEIRDLDRNNHCNLNGFFELFGSLAQNPETRYKYDYIVMEFDAQRIAASPTSGKSDGYVFNQWRDVMVAEWLNEYYEGVKDSPGSRIIWIVDDQVNKTGKSETSPKDLLNGSETAEDFFRPYQAHISGNSNHFRYEEMTDDRFRALLALLNPWLYLEAGLENATSAADLAARLDSCCGTHDYVFHQDSSTAGAWDAPRTVRVGETYKYQAYYNDLDGLKKFLDENIKVTSYAAEITDNVETEGLGLVEGTLKIYGAYATNGLGKAEQWTELQSVGQPGMSASGTVWAVGNSITGITENITREFWNWVVVDIKDTNGQFRAGAKYDAALGKYVRDPNLNTNALDVTEGEAAVVYFYDVTNPDDGVDAEATTTWDWEFDSLPIDLKTFGVRRMYDGTPTNATYTVDPSDAEIKVAYSVDKTNWTDPEAWSASKFTDCTNVWVRFVASKAGFVTQTNDFSQVVITQRLVVVTAKSDSKVYDGTPLTNNGYDVSPTEGDGFVTGEGYSSSSLPMTGDSTITNVGSTNNVVNDGSAAFKSNTKPGNYRFDYRKGSLTISKRQIVPGESGDTPIPDKDLAYATGVEKFYDGKPSTIAVGVKGVVEGAMVTKKYFDHAPASDAEPGVDALSFTNYTDGAKWIWCRVTAGDNFIGCVVSNTVTIKKRTVTVTADSKWKQYDGNPLTCSTYKITPFASPSYGFVSGEGFDSVVMTADSKITEVGWTNNVIAKVESELKTNTNPANYIINYVNGRLTVYSVPPPPPPKHEQEWLYPDGDGCQTIDGSKVQKYMGTVISSSDADGVVGTIEVVTSKANRNGTIKIKAVVNLRKSGKSVKYNRSGIDVTAKTCSLTVDMAKVCCKHGLPPRLILTFNGSSMTGVYDEDCFIDGAINVFADKTDPRRAALDPYAGTWNGVFALDGDMPGDALFSVTIQSKSGKVAAKCLMPDGIEYSWSTVAQVGANDFCVVPLLFSKFVSGAIRSLGARMTFDPGASVERIRNISDWQIGNRRAQVLSTVGKVDEYTFCRMEMPVSDFNTLTPVVIDAPEWLPLEADKVAFKFNAQTGKVTGKMTWVVIDKTGKKKMYTGKVQGYAVGSECVGNVTIGKMGTYQIVFVKSVE